MPEGWNFDKIIILCDVCGVFIKQFNNELIIFARGYKCFA